VRVRDAGQGSRDLRACDNNRGWRNPDASDGIGLAEKLLGLDAFQVMAVTETEHRRSSRPRRTLPTRGLRSRVSRNSCTHVHVSGYGCLVGLSMDARLQSLPRRPPT
jgi:hypothetical protein